MKTFYDILKVSENASIDEIKTSYEALKAKYEEHLLIPENKEMAEQYLKKLEVAIVVLGNEENKKAYDADLVKMRNNELMANLQNNTNNYNKEQEEKEMAQRELEEKARLEQEKIDSEELKRKKLEIVKAAIDKQIQEQQEQIEKENALRKQMQEKIEKEYKKYVFKNKKFSITRTIIATVIVLGAVFLIYQIPFVKNMVQEKIDIITNIFG